MGLTAAFCDPWSYFLDALGLKMHILLATTVDGLLATIMYVLVHVLAVCTICTVCEYRHLAINMRARNVGRPCPRMGMLIGRDRLNDAWVAR